MTNNTVPKIIHYCWFGGNPLPEMAQKCIASWKKYCPDYEIIEWNESNFDLNYCNYVREAYEAKKWAFVSDVARLYALVNYGGIYMDTDVELVRPIDGFLEYEAFSGFESKESIPTGLMACRKEHPLFMEFLQDYDTIHFLKDNGSYDTTTNVVRMTNICLNHGLKLNNEFQIISGFALFPSDYFCPLDYVTKTLTVTPNTYAIHYFNGSWMTDEDKLFVDAMKKYSVSFPMPIAWFISSIKSRGLSATLSKMMHWLTHR